MSPNYFIIFDGNVGIFGSGTNSRIAHNFSKSSRNRCEKITPEPTNKERPHRPLLFSFFLRAAPLLSIISTPPKTIMNDKKLSFINNFF